LKIPVKRIEGYAKHLLWRRPDGTTGMIELVDEDARNAGDVTWKGLEFLNEDDTTQEEKLRAGRRKSRSRVSVKQQEKVMNAETNRADPIFDGLTGKSTRDARDNAQAKRDENIGRAQAEAAGVKVPAVRVRKSQSGTAIAATGASEASYLQRIKTRLSEIFSSEDFTE
jgi:hypothetical protein